MKPREAEELEALLASAGWSYFEALVETRFPMSYYRHQVVDALDLGDPHQVALKVARIEAEYAALDQVLQLPSIRLEELRRLEEHHATNRG